MDLVPAMKGLSERQRLYVQARLEGNMPVESARRAGLEVPEVNWRSMEIAAPALAAVLTMRSASAMSRAIGFSQKTCFPAFRASTVTPACHEGGRHTSTTSIWGSASRSSSLA